MSAEPRPVRTRNRTRARARRVAVAVPAGLIALGLLAGCGGAPGGSNGGRGGDGDGSGFFAGDGTIQVVSAADREPAPGLVGTTLAGQPFDLAALRGQIVVLNVWASWCAPCRAEAPNLEKVWLDTMDDGVRFVGINTRDEPENARAFERRAGITYPSVVDRDGELLLAFRTTLPPAAIPTTLVIDREGRMAARALTPLTEESLRELLAPILAGG